MVRVRPSTLVGQPPPLLGQVAFALPRRSGWLHQGAHDVLVPTCAQTHHGLEARSWDEVSNRKSRALLGWNSFCYTPHCFSWRTIGGHEPHSREYSYYDGPRAHIRQPASGNSYWCGRRDLRSCLEFVMRTPAATGRTSDREVEIGNNRNVTVGSRRRKAMPIYLIGDSGVAKVQYVRH